MNILQEAEQIINGGRQLEYGSPGTNWEIIANLWSAWIHGRYKTRIGLDYKDVAYMMDLLKTARAATGDPMKRDTLVDKAGYMGALELAGRENG